MLTRNKFGLYQAIEIVYSLKNSVNHLADLVSTQQKCIQVLLNQNQQQAECINQIREHLNIQASVEPSAIAISDVVKSVDFNTELIEAKHTAIQALKLAEQIEDLKVELAATRETANKAFQVVSELQKIEIGKNRNGKNFNKQKKD